MRKQILPFANVIAYCLMPNHFHWLLHVKGDEPGFSISKAEELVLYPSDRKPSGQTGRVPTSHPMVRKIAVLLSSYTQAINRQENRIGSLFQSRTKAKKLISRDRSYPQTCFHYIHQNPLKASLVQQMSEWEFSSYKDYAGLRNGTLPNKDFTFRWLDLEDEKAFIRASQQTLDPDKLKKCF